MKPEKKTGWWNWLICLEPDGETGFFMVKLESWGLQKSVKKRKWQCTELVLFFFFVTSIRWHFCILMNLKIPDVVLPCNYPGKLPLSSSMDTFQTFIFYVIVAAWLIYAAMLFYCKVTLFTGKDVIMMSDYICDIISSFWTVELQTDLKRDKLIFRKF